MTKKLSAGVILNINKLLGKVTVSSALSDIIWIIAAFLIFISFLIWIKAAGWIILLAFVVLIFILLYTLYSHNYFMKNNADYLRSETYQLHKQELEMKGSKEKEVSPQVIEAEPVIEKPSEKKQRKKKEIIIVEGGNKK